MRMPIQRLCTGNTSDSEAPVGQRPGKAPRPNGSMEQPSPNPKRCIAAAAGTTSRAAERCLCQDIANGKEAQPIPVFNGIDDEPAPKFQYITQVHMHTKAWQVVREAAASDWKFCIPSGPFLPAPASRMYDKCGRLTSDHGDYLYLGIDERGAKPEHQVTSNGVRLPLQVFKVSQEKGWGLRCCADIPAGTFVCEYMGELISEKEANKKGRPDKYLYCLEHYELVCDDEVKEDPSRKEYAEQRCLPVLTAPPTLDALRKGNVSRFLNHDDNGNVDVAVVFSSKLHSTVYFRICFFAFQDIPAYTELTYNYRYTEDTCPEWLERYRARQGHGGASAIKPCDKTRHPSRPPDFIQIGNRSRRNASKLKSPAATTPTQEPGRRPREGCTSSGGRSHAGQANPSDQAVAAAAADSQGTDMPRNVKRYGNKHCWVVLDKSKEPGADADVHLGRYTLDELQHAAHAADIGLLLLQRQQRGLNYQARVYADLMTRNGCPLAHSADAAAAAPAHQMPETRLPADELQLVFEDVHQRLRAGPHARAMLDDGAAAGQGGAGHPRPPARQNLGRRGRRSQRATASKWDEAPVEGSAAMDPLEGGDFINLVTPCGSDCEEGEEPEAQPEEMAEDEGEEGGAGEGQERGSPSSASSLANALSAAEHGGAGGALPPASSLVVQSTRTPGEPESSRAASASKSGDKGAVPHDHDQARRRAPPCPGRPPVGTAFVKHLETRGRGGERQEVEVLSAGFVLKDFMDATDDVASLARSADKAISLVFADCPRAPPAGQAGNSAGAGGEPWGRREFTRSVVLPLIVNGGSLAGVRFAWFVAPAQLGALLDVCESHSLKFETFTWVQPPAADAGRGVCCNTEHFVVACPEGEDLAAFWEEADPGRYCTGQHFDCVTAAERVRGGCGEPLNPRQKPVGLLMRVLDMCVDETPLVVDLTCGTGTMAVAASARRCRSLAPPPSGAAVLGAGCAPAPPPPPHVILVDVDPVQLEAARARLCSWGKERGRRVLDGDWATGTWT